MMKNLLSIFLMVLGISLHSQVITPTQTDELIIDNGTSGKADPGDRIRYKVTITNTAGPAGTNVQLNVTPDALLTNFKSLAFTFTPDEEAKAVRITIDPPLRQVEVVNNLT